MKLLSTTITESNGIVKKVTVCVDNATAEALALCSEDIRQIYILFKNFLFDFYEL